MVFLTSRASSHRIRIALHYTYQFTNNGQQQQEQQQQYQNIPSRIRQRVHVTIINVFQGTSI